MNIDDYNFNSCLFNPKDRDFVTDIEKAIPAFKAFKKIKERRRLFTWVVSVYDMRSPLRLRAGNYYEKKRICAEIAGWERNEVGYFKKEVEKYLLGMDEQVNELIASYLANLNLPQFTQLITYLEMQYKLTQSILAGKTDNNTAKTMDFITEKIGELTRIIFGSGEVDEIMEARKALYAVAEKERMKLNIESIVKYIQENKKLPKDFNPYGENYEVEDLHFISDEGEQEIIGGL